MDSETLSDGFWRHFRDNTLGFRLAVVVFAALLCYVTQRRLLFPFVLLGFQLARVGFDVAIYTRYSLRSLLIAILTLQIPVVLFFASDVLALQIIAIILLAIWAIVIAVELDKQIKTGKEKAKAAQAAVASQEAAK